MPNAFAQCRAPLKLSPALAMSEAEDVLASVEDIAESLTENNVGCGFASAMPFELVVRRGGGGASLSRFPTVAARCRSSKTMGTVMATVENASWAHNEGCIGHHACMHTRVIGTHFGTGFLLRSVGSSNPRIELEREDSGLESAMSFEAR